LIAQSHATIGWRWWVHTYGYLYAWFINDGWISDRDLVLHLGEVIYSVTILLDTLDWFLIDAYDDIMIQENGIAAYEL